MEEGKCLLVKGKTFGVGEEELGYILMRGFFRQLTKNSRIPKSIIFINEGVKLLVDEEVLESLKALEELGVELLGCGTCLDYYHLKGKIGAGKVSNMGEITAILLGPKEIVTL